MSEPLPMLQLVGASHRTAPLELRERLTLDEIRREALYERLQKMQGLSEAVLLSTCNRVELYYVSGDEVADREARDLYCEITGLDPMDLPRHGLHCHDQDVTRHLMEVCSGIDSQIIGEPEILGQVKQAYADATERGCAGPVMHRLFQKSFQAAKWVRTHSGISEGQVSLGNVAVDLARRIFGDLARSRVLVVGSGKVGADVAHALHNRGARSILVSSRTAARAEALANAVGGQALPFEDWSASLSDSDVCVFCTSAPHVVLNRQTVAQALAKRPGRPLFLIDLAVPHDVDPAARDLDNVFLYNFGELAKMANENMKGRMANIDHCRSALAERAERLWAELREVQNSKCRVQS